MSEKGFVTVYFYVYTVDIDNKPKRTKIVLHKQGDVTLQQARGLYLDVAGMNNGHGHAIHYEWVFSL